MKKVTIEITGKASSGRSTVLEYIEKALAKNSNVQSVEWRKIKPHLLEVTLRPW